MDTPLPRCWFLWIQSRVNSLTSWWPSSPDPPPSKPQQEYSLADCQKTLMQTLSLLKPWFYTELKLKLGMRADSDVWLALWPKYQYILYSQFSYNDMSMYSTDMVICRHTHYCFFYRSFVWLATESTTMSVTELWFWVWTQIDKAKWIPHTKD